MSCCVIFGGAGFVGTHLARRFLESGRFTQVHLADIRQSVLAHMPGISTSLTDVRQPIPEDLMRERPEWVFNLAAIHREPGHQPYEYYETNLAGAKNCCAYAERVGCDNIYFTSSISVYGPTTGPTKENAPIRPITPYGGSKYPAEVIHQVWREAKSNRRLLISRPAVLYGPGDPGNIMRMIKAIRKGYFAFPGSPKIHKSYGYIYGFGDSIEFVMDRPENSIIYNYAENPTQPLGDVVDDIKQYFRCKAVTLPIPMSLLMSISQIVQRVIGSRNPVHPVRVRKAGTPTHIVPDALKELGFRSKYGFLDSLEHWTKVAPSDFELTRRENAPSISIRLVKRDSEMALYGEPGTSSKVCEDEPSFYA